MAMPAASPEWAFFLDVDGTLLEHANHPQGVEVGPVLKKLLERLLHASGGAVALISGRSVADLESLFEPLEFAAAGQHGNERRSASGELHAAAPPDLRLRVAAYKLHILAEQNPGLLLEDKVSSIALHYRMAPQLHDVAARAARSAAADLGGDFELQAGKYVYEIKPSGQNKGSAIARFMAEPPFEGRVPVFIGDDLTDEFGFALVNSIGGHSVKVGPGETAARWRLSDARAVQRWLAECAGSMPLRAGRTTRTARAAH
jgi:trehalose 6-phosphate phosphatase